MSRKGQSITLSLSERDKAELNKIALEWGKTWGDRANISKLIEAIARRELQIVANDDWSSVRINVLELAYKALIDLGKLPEAEEMARLLCDRSEISRPLRRDLEDFLGKTKPAWRQPIDDMIRQQQPFYLTYQDVAGHLWNYTVLFAKIAPLENRQYLICRCEESEGNQDIPELCHNWTLRLDRIQEATVSAIDRPWESDLQRISVELYLYDRLAFSYKTPKPDDIEIGKLESGEPARRRVVRNVFSTFWFFREISRYFENCEIVSPENVRHKYCDRLQKLIQRYNL